MILVTGASGFLGRHLVESLSRKGTPVRALYVNQQELPQFPHVTWQQCDLLNVLDLEEAMQDVSEVYHCAATVSFDPRNKERLIRENTAITENVVNAALETQIKKLVHVSSIATLSRKKDDPDSQKLITETDYFIEGKNNSLYSIGKYLGEMEVWRGIAEGLNAVIVNPGIILGTGDWTKGSAKLTAICYKEFPWFTEGITAWVGVQDVVNALLLLMESSISGERYILSEGNYAYKDIFTKIALALGKKPPHKPAKRWMTEFIWRASLIKSRLAGKEATITKETARTSQQIYRYDNRKFLNAFPAFHYTPIDITIAEMAKSFLSDQQN